MLCCAIGGKGGNTSFEVHKVHTVLVVVYTHIELKYKTLLGYEKSDNT